MVAGSRRRCSRRPGGDQPRADPQFRLLPPLRPVQGVLLLLGVLAHQLPAGLEARAALYRDRLNGRRALIVLDDAASEDQIYPLLPGTPGCLVLITSRR